MARIAKRYARALYNISGGDLAKAKTQQTALVALKELFEQKDAGRVLRSPVMPQDLKKALLDYGLKQVGADTNVIHLVQTVLEAGRVAFLPAVADAYGEFIDQAEGVARAEVVSAVPLGDQDQKQIAAALGRILEKKIEVKPSIDPALLGGFIARVGNFQIDMSLRTKLDGLAHSAVQDTL